jgi:hypothetical protein
MYSAKRIEETAAGMNAKAQPRMSGTAAKKIMPAIIITTASIRSMALTVACFARVFSFNMAIYIAHIRLLRPGGFAMITKRLSLRGVCRQVGDEAISNFCH